MNPKARAIARDILIGARVIEIKRRALAAAAAGDVVAPASPAAVPTRKLVLIPIADHGPGSCCTVQQLKPAKLRPRPLLILSPNRRRVLALIRHRP